MGCSGGGGGGVRLQSASFENVPKLSSFLGAEGGSKITKAHLSEMFRNSIILKGSEWLFHVGWGLMMFDI